MSVHPSAASGTEPVDHLGAIMQRPTTSFLAHLRHDEAGEGVISTAIAVLIMSIIGGLMWVAFDGVFRTAEERVTEEVNRIGES